MTVISTIGFVLATFALGFLPGWWLYCAFFEDEQWELPWALSVSFALSAGTIGAIQFVAFLLPGIPLLGPVLYLAMLFATARIARRRALTLLRRAAPLLCCFFLYYLYCVFLLLVQPGYEMAYMSDWLLYFPNVSLYRGANDPANFADGLAFEYLVRRTPLFSLASAFLLGPVGPRFDAYQITSTYLNSLIFWTVVLLASEGAKTKRIGMAVLLLPVIPMITSQVCVPTPKPLAAFFIVSASYLYLRLRTEPGGYPWRQAILLGLLGAGAFMTHPMSLFYLAWIPIDQAWLAIRHRPRMQWGRAVAAAAVIALVLVVPWFAWAVRCFGLQAVLTPTYTISETRVPVPWYVISRFTMLATSTVAPYPLIRAAHWWASLTSPGRPVLIAVIANPLVRAYLEVTIFGFTLIGLAFPAIAFRRAWAELPQSTRQLLGLLSLGGLTCLMFHFIVDHKGLAFNIAAPIVLVLFSLFARTACHCSFRIRRWIMMGMAVEFALLRCLIIGVTANDGLDFLPHIADVVGIASAIPMTVLALPGMAIVLAYVWAVMYLLDRPGGLSGQDRD